MKRWIGTLTLAAAAAAAVAQAPFTLVRPLDGATVKEKVRILIPKGSVPSNGYVGFFLNGTLLEATKPPLKGKFYEYILDTKGRGIDDTEPGKPAKLEAVLYADSDDQPRIVDRSSVDINIFNRTRIPVKVPNSGISLRYGWKSGSENVYTIEQKTVVSSITEDQNRLGGRAAEFPEDGDKLRYLYAVDNVYGNGDALLRMQPLPLKNKDYAIVTLGGNDTSERRYGSEMAPIYMRVNNVGSQLWGSVPPYIPSETSVAPGSQFDLVGSFPLPSLPTKSVRPGDAWQTRFQLGALDPSRFYEQTSVVRTFPARGEFVGLEWEMGHPCAKIRNSIAIGQNSIEAAKLKKAGSQFTSDVKVSMEETVWFALDNRKVLKIVRETTQEVKADAGQIGMMFGFAGASGQNGSSSGPGAAAGPSGAPRGAGGPRGVGTPGAAGKGSDFMGPLDLRQRPGSRPGGFPAGAPGQGGPQGGPSGYPGAGGRGGSGPTVNQQAFLRIKSLLIFTLER
ncbi:hypothetical protein EON81_11920 [bacterium]|nr:MAG: hypothetical protein EON81_11920 [bacterium]